jgi:hypothetical protein
MEVLREDVGDEMVKRRACDAEYAPNTGVAHGTDLGADEAGR